jgi:short-subunit dehydrogenase
VPDFARRYGPWAVVTGAAQGVGLAFADALLERGCSVVLLDRLPEVRDVAAERGVSARAVVADLADPGWLTVLAEAVEGLEVGLAVANAAVSFVGPFLAQPAESRAATVAVNCLATTELAAWALPPMVARGRGGFIVTSSGSALAGTAAVATYSASKAFGLNLAEAIGWELRDSGVDCLAVVAPSMDTPGWRSHPVDEGAMLQPVVDPRVVVEGALDHLAAGGCYLADAGLEVVAGIERRQRSDLLSSATVALYPEEMGAP